MSADGTNTTAPAVDLAAVKEKQRAAWGAGDYAVIGTTLQIVGEDLCEAVDLRAGEKVLDVAAGNGNASLAAARRGAEVLATDFVPALLERAKERASAERLPITIQEADAEALPYSDQSFDVVLSSFGVMFTPDQEKAASELLRVCRDGGRIGLANWTPDGLIGQLFRTISHHIPPPPGVRSPALWGRTERLKALFPMASIRAEPKTFVFRYRSAQHWLDVFERWYGPLQKAFASLQTEGQAALRADVLALLAAFNRSGDERLVAPSEYLEVVIAKP